MAKQTHVQIEGAFPALDRKKLGKPFVMDGKNYIVDLDGPRSAFGYQCPHDLFTPNQFMQSFAIGNEIFYFARDIEETITQISTVSWPSRQVIPVLKFTTDALRPKLNMPWSHAFVGTYHYFANRTSGVLRYDAINRIWEDITATLGINNVFFVAESAGRLICLAEGISSWSAIDDGTDNVPSLTTGAGFQALSLIGSLESDNDYLGLQTTARGYLSFTRKGVLRSEIIDSLNPFRHLPGESKQVALTAWNVTKISDTEVVILSRQGLFKTEDGFFKEWQPLMGEYFKDTEIPTLQSQTNGFISIYYSRARDEFYVSFAQAEGVSQYTKSWVLYVKAAKWGSFNRVFKGLVFIDPEADGIDFKQAYVDNSGHLCYLDDSVVSLALEAQNLNAIYVQPLLEYPTYKLDDTWLMSTNVRMASFSAVPYPAIAGWYEELGAQECYKTEEIGIVKSVTEDVLQGIQELIDTSVVSTSWIDSLWAAVPISAGKTIRLEWHFEYNSSRPRDIYVRIKIGAASFATARYDMILGIITIQINCTITVTSLGGDKYRMDVDWISDATFNALTEFRVYPNHNNDATLLGSAYINKFTAYDVAVSTVELLPSTDFSDIANWAYTNTDVIYHADIMPTDVTINGQICVLGAIVQEQTQIPVDSFIEVGLFRFSDEVANDQISLVTNVAISCLDETDSTVGSFDDWFEDYAVDIFEDWLAITPDVFEDWGLELASGSVYTQKIRGSLDGYKTFEDQFVDIAEVVIEGKTKFCSSENAGLFHGIEISALNLGESYHVKTLELNGTLIGRL